MRRFVMGDIHGAYSSLLQCLERAGFNYERDSLIQLGDVVDGHDGAYDCVEHLLKIKNLICIKGNHDAWFLEFIRTGSHPKRWHHGGEATLTSYMRKCMNEKDTDIKMNNPANLKPLSIPETHRDFFYNQLPYHETKDKLLFVHAGFKPYVPLQHQGIQLYDDRNFWDEIKKYKNSSIPEKFSLLKDYRTVYIGHSPTTKSGTDQPIQILNIINLDTGAAKGNKGRLTIMDIDSGSYWQSDILD